MSWDRAAHDAFDRQLGYSQEYLDRVHKGAEEYRAYLDAQGRLNTSWEAAESDSDYDNVPLSPPRTPKHQSPDPLSKDQARIVVSKQGGLESVKPYGPRTIPKQARNISPPPKLPVRRAKRRSALTISGRTTRSHVATATVFYELGHDGKTAQSLLTTSPTKLSISFLSSRRAARSSQQRKHRSIHRVQKK